MKQYSFEAIRILLRSYGKLTSNMCLCFDKEASKSIYKGYYIGIGGCILYNICISKFRHRIGIGHFLPNSIGIISVAKKWYRCITILNYGHRVYYLWFRLLLEGFSNWIGYFSKGLNYSNLMLCSSIKCSNVVLTFAATCS